MMMLVVMLGAALAFEEPSAGADPQTFLDQSLRLRARTRELAAEGDWRNAFLFNLQALDLQPGHYGLLTNAAIIAFNDADVERTMLALALLARAGGSFDLPADMRAALQDYDAGWLAELESVLTMNGSATGHAERYLSTPLPNALIEALAVDIDAERLYLGSVASRALYSVSLESPQNPERLAGPDEGLGSVFGLAIDGRARILYAATGTVPQTPLGEDETIEPALVAYDLLTGEISHRHTIDGAGRFSDVVAQDGIVYTSDAEGGRIYVLSEPGGTLELYAEDSRLASLQGLALTRGALFAVDYATGLWRIDPITREPGRVEVSEGSLIGFDGLATDSYGELYGIRNGSRPHGLFHITLQGFGNGARVTPVLTGHPDFGDPVTVRISDGRFFILANAQWDLFPEDGGPPAGERRNPIVLFKPVP